MPAVIQDNNFQPKPPDGFEDLAEDILNTLKLATERAVAHRVNPSENPLSQPDPFEEAALELFDDSEPEAQAMIKERVMDSINQPLEAREEQFGDMARVSFRSNKSVSEQVKSIRKEVGGGFTFEDVKRVTFKKPGVSLQLQQFVIEQLPGIAEPAQAAVNRNVGHLNPDLGFQGVGPIQTKYIQLGRRSGPLGRKEGQERFVKDHKGRRVRMQRYKNGAIYYAGVNNEAFAIFGEVAKKYEDLGGIQGSSLSVPVTDAYTTKGGGQRVDFIGGQSIIHNPGYGTFLTFGAIVRKYREMNAEEGVCGLPISDEITINEQVEEAFGKYQGGRIQKFRYGAIYWHPDNGSRFIINASLSIWLGALSPWGTVGHLTGDSVMTLAPGQQSNFPNGLWITPCEGGVISSPGGISRPFAKVNLRLHEVRCIDDTNELTKDEIDMGGVSIDFRGKTEKIDNFPVAKFKKGDVKTYNPPKVLSTAYTNRISSWPASCSFACAVAETDWGSKRFEKYLDKIFDNMKRQVEEEVEKRIDELSSEVTQSVAQEAGPVIGLIAGAIVSGVLGAIASYVLGKLWDWLGGLYGDVTFKPFVLDATLDNIRAFGSDKTGPILTRSVKGYGGHYRLKFSFAGAD